MLIYSKFLKLFKYFFPQAGLAIVTCFAGALGIPLPDPDSPVYYGGFQPVDGSRGFPENSGDGYSGGHGGGGAVASGSGPTKTIYVNVPRPEAQPPPKPIAAGPPRKHYKIVFIRAPTPPPPPQPILPPRTEQKTIIYVLHQKPQQQEQNVISVPSIKHNPEVYFVQYDNPPTAEELQQLSTGDLSSFGVAQSYGSPGGDSISAGSAPVPFDVRVGDEVVARQDPSSGEGSNINTDLQKSNSLEDIISSLGNIEPGPNRPARQTQFVKIPGRINFGDKN